jgi:acyl transferase domain-containing protein
VQTSVSRAAMTRHADLIESADAAPDARAPGPAPAVLRLAAPTAGELDTRSDELIARLVPFGDMPLHTVLDDVLDRQAIDTHEVHRRVIVATTAAEAARALSARAPAQVFTRQQTRRHRGVTLLFAGLGDHYAGMGRALYESQPAFRAALDLCAQLAAPQLGVDLRKVIFPVDVQPASTASPASSAHAAGRLNLRAMVGRERGAIASATASAAAPTAGGLADTRLAQPAVFAIDYAVWRLLDAWGIRATAAIGHSLGEYAAAVAANVMTLADAMRVVCERAALIAAQPRGAMLAVAAPADEAMAAMAAIQGDLAPAPPDDVDLAAVNGAQAIVLSGAPDAIDRARAALAAAGISSRLLPASHAFHSRQLRPAAAALTACVRTIRLNAPSLPIVSNLTGDWLTAQQAADPEYWAHHMCEPVRFADGIGRVLAETDSVLLEVGPGASLGSFARQHPACDSTRVSSILTTIPLVHQDRTGDAMAFQIMLGKLWLSGADVDWPKPRKGGRHD